MNAHSKWAFVSIDQWGKFSHFQPAPSAAMSMATGTSHERSRMSFLLEDGGLRGRLLIGIETPAALPSAGDHESCATGSSKLNVEPCPGLDSTHMSPSIVSTSSRQM